MMKILPERIDQRWINMISDEELHDSCLESYETFCRPAKELVQRGGKRWRPLMMVLIAEMLGGKEAAERVYPLTPVVELPHNGSLIIDDIEDSSEVRRGAPAAHITHGVDLAINAGNLLYYLPTVCIDTCDLSDAQKLNVHRIYSTYLRRVHLGQGLDILWHKDPTIFPSIEEYEQMCMFKTGCLAGMSAEIGACIAGADQELISRSGHLAQEIGIAFQIKDDLINLRSGNPGKVRGDDILENKKSLPILLYLQQRPQQMQYVLELFTQVRTLGLPAAVPRIEEFIQELQRHSILEMSQQRAAMHIDSSLQAIRDLYSPSTAREELIELLMGFLSA